MASHTLPFPPEKPNPPQCLTQWFACTVGEVIGLAMVLPFLSLDRYIFTGNNPKQENW
jgi:hypothetical protein